MLASGLRGRVVAEAIDVSPQTISEWKNDPEFKGYLNNLMQEALDEARDQIRALAAEATNNLQDLMQNAQNEEVRRKASMNVLDIVGITDPSAGRYGWGIGSTPLHQKWSGDEHGKQMEELMMKFNY